MEVSAGRFSTRSRAVVVDRLAFRVGGLSAILDRGDPDPSREVELAVPLEMRICGEVEEVIVQSIAVESN